MESGHDGSGHDGSGHDGSGHDGSGHDGSGHDGWGRRLMGEATTGGAWSMPRRVVDGIVSELLRRRLWCLAAASLSGAGSLSDLVVTLRERGREVVLLSDDSAVGDPVGDPTVGRFAYVAEACARYGVSTADTVMVCADLSGDTALFGPEGARVLVVDERVAPVRGVVAVATIEQVRQLFDQAVSYRATSTYHEV